MEDDFDADLYNTYKQGVLDKLKSMEAVAQSQTETHDAFANAIEDFYHGN